MLAGAVDTVERLLMQQANHAVLQGNLLCDVHQQLVVIGCNVGGGEDRCDLMLCRCNLVVLGLSQQAVLPQLNVEVSHECGDARLDGAEVMIFHLLTLRAHCAEQGAAGEDQVLALVVILLVNQEVFLLRTYGGGNALDILAEQLHHAACLLADRVHGAQQRGLLIQRFTGIRTECSRDVQGAVLDKGIGARIPCGIAACLEGCAQAAGRERGCIRLALNQFLAAERHDDLAARSRGDKGVMLLRGDTGHRLEPVGVMGGALLDRPILHCVRNDVCNAYVERLAEVDGLHQLLEDFLRQLVAHYVFIKYVLGEYLRNVNHCTTHLHAMYLLN